MRPVGFALSCGVAAGSHVRENAVVCGVVGRNQAGIGRRRGRSVVKMLDAESAKTEADAVQEESAEDEKQPALQDSSSKPVVEFYDGPGPGMRELSELELAEQKKVLVQFSEQLKNERLEREMDESRLFGFTRRAEVLNGRIAMFFFATGLLTEYWTGESIPDQIETLFRTLGVI